MNVVRPSDEKVTPERYCSSCHPYGWPNGPMPHEPWCTAAPVIRPSNERGYLPGDYVFSEGKPGLALRVPQIPVLFEDGTILWRPIHCVCRISDAPAITVEQLNKARELVPDRVTPSETFVVPVSPHMPKRERPAKAPSKSGLRYQQELAHYCGFRWQWLNLPPSEQLETLLEQLADAKDDALRLHHAYVDLKFPEMARSSQKASESLKDHTK